MFKQFKGAVHYVAERRKGVFWRGDYKIEMWAKEKFTTRRLAITLLLISLSLSAISCFMLKSLNPRPGKLFNSSVETFEQHYTDVAVIVCFGSH